MRLFDLLKVWEPAFDPPKAKIHLARYNGNERPLDVFLEGTFDWWQRWQTKRNFQREFVVSLVNTGSPTRWLYAGLFRSIDYAEEADPKPHYFYTLERVHSCEAWVGRLYLESVYTGRPPTSAARLWPTISLWPNCYPSDCRSQTFQASRR